MPPNSNNTKVWNEDLVKALEARHQQAWQQQRQTQYMWRDGAKTIESVRKDIRLTSTGKIYNLPTQDAKKFCKTVYEECVKIVKEEVDIYPPGFAPLSAQERQQMADVTFLPFIDKMARESGGYAIMLAFHFSGRDSLSIDQICTMAQPYCRDEMRANYHAGRMYGAWKSKDTLVRHGLITEHKAGARWTEGGFRSNGKNTYSISADGKKAIQQMLQKWPDIARNASPLSQDIGVGDPDSFPSPGFARKRTPAGSSSRTATPKGAKSGDDEQELRAWVDTAPAGSQKVFKVGKSRRHYLHNLCDKLEQTYPGLKFSHESEPGTGTRRDLYITLRGKPSSSIGLTTPSASASSTKKRPISTIFGSGQKVGGTNGSIKKPRSAKHAAAKAALARFEESATKITKPAAAYASTTAIAHHPIVELLSESDEEDGKHTTVSTRGQCTKGHPIVELLHSGSEEEDRKPAAIARGDNVPTAADKPTCSNPYDYQPGDQCWQMSGGGPFQIVRVHCDGHVTIRLPDTSEKKLNVRDIQPTDEAIAKHATSRKETVRTRETTAAPPRKASAKSDIIDLYDGEFDASSRRVAAKGAPVSPGSKLVILIDDRERSRNHKPRELRIELAKELASGSLKAVCSAEMPAASVEERKLHYGDFAYEMTGDDGSGRYSVVVERKRVGDLIQRSTYGDHWKQLARMRDSCQHAIMLIETDTRVAAQFDAYGSQSRTPKPSHHTIENESDIFLFVGRAILSSSRIKFVQTRDARSTFRSIGAIGFMAQVSTNVNHHAPINPPNSATEQRKLSDHLTCGGVHWKLAKEIALQFGSIAALQSAFNSCSSQAAKQVLVEPMLRNMGEMHDCPGSLRWWAEAIFVAFSSSKDVRTAKKLSYLGIKDIVGESICDPAVLLYHVYLEDTPDAAMTAAMDYSSAPDVTSRRRVVEIQISKAFEMCFDKPSESSFYTLRLADDNPWSLPGFMMLTSSGGLYSGKMAVHVIEGSKVVEDVVGAMESTESSSFVTVAKGVANKWSSLCQLNRDSEKTSRSILLIRGLGPALDKAAKAASYRIETPVLCEMAFASLMIDHNIVVLQAIRKKMEETTLIFKQLALACYHYHLLHHERP